MKKAGWILLAALVLALIFGIYYVVRIPEKEPEIIGAEETLPEGFSVKLIEENIEKITLRNSEGVFEFEKENGQWMTVFDKKLRTEGNAITAIEAIIKDTRAVDEIEKNASSLKVYGLDKPMAQLSYVTESGEKGFIKLGNSVAGIKHYFTLDDKTVYTMDLSEAGMFMVSMKAFMNMDLLSADIQQISKITIVNDSTEIILEQKSESEKTEGDASSLFGYALKSPVKENASNSAVQTLMQMISDIDADYYNPYMDDETAGFTESLKSFSVTVAGKEEKFVLGKKVGEDAVYVKKEGSDGVYTVSLGALAFMDYTAFDLVDKHIVLYYLQEISCIRMETSGEVYEFMLGADKTLNGESIDEEKLANFYEALMGLSYEGTVSEEFEAEGLNAEIKVILYKDGKKDITEYVPYDAMNYAVRRNGATELTIQRKYLEKILSLAKEM